MSRILAVKSTEGEREVDYSVYSVKELQKQIKQYEKKFGSFIRFLRQYDCESSPAEDYLTLIDWECLQDEQKRRKRAKLSLIRGGRKRPG